MRACRKILGNHHTNTLISINNLARLLQDMGKLEEAKPLCEEALEASKEMLGDRHPQTLQSINNMAGLLKAMGKLEDAKKLLHEALQARRKTTAHLLLPVALRPPPSTLAMEVALEILHELLLVPGKFARPRHH